MSGEIIRYSCHHSSRGEREETFGNSSITDKIHIKMGREEQGREEGERREGGQRVFIAGPSCEAHIGLDVL